MRPKTIGPKQIGEKLSSKWQLPKKVSIEMVEDVFSAVEEFVPYSPVRTPIGMFRLKTQKERNSRNPKTGETIIVPAKVKLTFRPSKKN